MMDTLPFRLHDFTRRQWTSPEARRVWEPRLQAVAQAWSEIERMSVAAGVRAAHLTSMRPESMPDAAAWAARHGLALLPLSRTRRSASYSASSETPQEGQPWDFRAAYVQLEHAEEWSEAWAGSDDRVLGTLLGYPDCCRSFFDRTWGVGQVDTTWQMGGGGEARERDLRYIDPHNQILGRWAGYRAVPHLPCSWDCEATRAFGRQLLDVGRELGFDEEVAWLLEALSWPYEWSALHGIAEIRSPILRITTRTVATRHPLVIRVHSEVYPEAGARGTRHPYRTWKDERAQFVQLERRSSSARRNGFSSDAGMEAAHGVLLRALEEVRTIDSVLDLGAGDGALLNGIAETTGASELHGIEIDPDRQAGALEPATIHVGDIAETELWDRSWDLIVLMPGRLLEMEAEDRARVRAALGTRGARLLLYAYGDWLERHGGLGPLVEEALPELGPFQARAVGEGAAASLHSLATAAGLAGHSASTIRHTE